MMFRPWVPVLLATALGLQSGLVSGSDARSSAVSSIEVLTTEIGSNVRDTELERGVLPLVCGIYDRLDELGSKSARIRSAVCLATGVQGDDLREEGMARLEELSGQGSAMADLFLGRMLAESESVESRIRGVELIERVYREYPPDADRFTGFVGRARGLLFRLSARGDVPGLGSEDAVRYLRELSHSDFRFALIEALVVCTGALSTPEGSDAEVASVVARANELFLGDGTNRLRHRPELERALEGLVGDSREAVLAWSSVSSRCRSTVGQAWNGHPLPWQEYLEHR